MPVTAPLVGPTAQAPCRQLGAKLPDTLADSYHRRTVRPDSPYTAAWGDPPIRLRCGVAPPRRPLVGDELVINGVTWLVEQAGTVVSWRTVDRAVTVRLDVPGGYDDQDAVAADVSAVVSAALPAAPRP